MSEEVKEILYLFKKYNFEDTMIDSKECKLLYDYIINLQNKYENQIHRYNNQKIIITNLQKENKELKETIKEYTREITDLEFENLLKGDE